MICAIHQPHYLPWLRYFDKIARADVFVILDDIQYSRNGWQNRNRIKGPQGVFALTVPVRHRFQCPLPEVEIANDRWRRAHLAALRTSYGRAPGFARFFPALEKLLSRPHASLVELNCEMLVVLCEALGITTPLVRSSSLRVPGAATERLVQLCREVGATHYLTGAYAMEAYLDPAVFAAQGIGLLSHVWSAPLYRQCHSQAGFAPDLSIVDLLAAEDHAAASILGSAASIRAEAAASAKTSNPDSNA